MVGCTGEWGRTAPRAVRVARVNTTRVRMGTLALCCRSVRHSAGMAISPMRSKNSSVNKSANEGASLHVCACGWVSRWVDVWGVWVCGGWVGRCECGSENAHRDRMHMRHNRWFHNSCVQHLEPGLLNLPRPCGPSPLFSVCSCFIVISYYIIHVVCG